jgi:predicted nuclease of predicted toxin-antitoxin system
MNFVADENIDQQIVAKLRATGYTILAVAEMAPSISDAEVLQIANQQGMVLLTSDKDFGDLVYRDRRYTFGVLLLRLAGLSPTAKAELVLSVIEEHADKLAHAFTVVSLHNVRIRSRLL